MPPSNKPTKSVTVRVPTEIYRAALEKAEADHRTLSNYLVALMARDVEEHDQEPGSRVAETGPKYRANREK